MTKEDFKFELLRLSYKKRDIEKILQFHKYLGELVTYRTLHTKKRITGIIEFESDSPHIGLCIRTDEYYSTGVIKTADMRTFKVLPENEKIIFKLKYNI